MTAGATDRHSRRRGRPAPWRRQSWSRATTGEGVRVTLALLLMLVGALSVVVPALSGKWRELPLSEPLLVLLLGAVAGPQLLNRVALKPATMAVALTETFRLLLALSLMEPSVRTHRAWSGPARTLAAARPSLSRHGRPDAFFSAQGQ